ncbi:MAG: hypothetical protein ABJB01_12850 [Rudaea sp.]
MRNTATARTIARATLALLGFAASAHAATGGPFGGSIFALRADPANAARLYATTSNGFYRSDDNGATWASKETGILSQHPTNGVFSVSSSGLWLLDDAGNLNRSNSAGDSWAPTGYTSPPVTTLSGLNVVAQGSGSQVWFAANANGLLVSNDNGATFALAAGTGLPAGQSFASVITDPNNPAHVFAGSTTSCDGLGVCPIYVSSDGGATWGTSTLTGTISGAGFTQHLIGAAFTSGVVYGLYGDANLETCSTSCVYLSSVLRSTDNGLSWTAHTYTSAEAAKMIATAPAAANTAWVDAQKSIDGGVTFNPLATTGRTTNGVLIPTASAVAVSINYASTPRLWIGTQYAGIYASSDGGATWASSSTGMTASDIRSVVVHPADSSVVYAGYADSISDPSQALLRASSGGVWSVSNSGLNAYQVRTVLIDPTTTATVAGTTVYAVGSGFDNSGGTSPNPEQCNSGIYKSTDGGATWVTENGGIPVFGPGGVYAGGLRTIIADPRSCVGNAGPTGVLCSSGPLRTLYVTGAGRSQGSGAHLYRVMKSIDGGVNWADSSTGLPNDIVATDPNQCASQAVGGVTPIVMDASDSRVLYIGTFAEAYDTNCQPISPSVASGVYKSIDSGANWTWTSAGLRTYDGSTAGAAPGAVSVLDTLSLAIDPTNSQTLWVSTKDLNLNTGAPGELYKSTNGGANWSLSNSGVTGPGVRALLVDPANPGTIYAAGGGVDAADPGGVYKSTNGGATWKSISVGLPAFSATALTLDPADSSTLYAGTTGGVYSLVQLLDSDGDGVPDVVEDAGANNGDANADGTKDKNQATVATVPAGMAGTYGWQSGVAAAHRAAQQNTTAVTSDFYVKTVPSGSGSDCKQTVDVAMIDPALLGTDSVAHHGTYTYPNGVVHFEIPNCAAANVDVAFSSASFGAGWSWRYYGPSTPGDASTLGWHDATSLVLSRIGGDWKVHLANGQFGSYRPAVADSILFEGGPAYNETIFNDTFQ